MTTESIAHKTFLDQERINGSLYRIMTENLNHNGILALAARFFDAFSVYTQVGYWKGEAEQSVVIEIVTDATDRVRLLAEGIKTLNHQDAVLVERIDNNAWLV